MTKRAARLFLVLVLLLARPCLLHALNVGDPAKDFALADAGGTIVTLNETTKGASLTVLEFLSAYCGACQKKAPYLNGLALKYKAQGLRMLAVALANDQQETAGIIKDWAIPYPVLPDPEKKTFHLYGISSVPQFFIVDSAGIIRYKGNADNQKELESSIERLLQNSASSGLKPGDLASAMSLPDSTGATVDVQLKGSTANTILAFFSEDKKANRKLAQTLCRLSAQSAAGVRTYAILPQSMQKSAGKLTGTCSALQVLIDIDGRAFQSYGITGAPEVILLSRSGYVRQRSAPQSLSGLADLLKPSVAAAAAVDEKQLAQHLHRAIPGASEIRPVRIGNRETVYICDTGQGKRLARVVKKDILCEVCTDIYFILTLDKNGIYNNLTLINPFELSGKTIDASAFTRQFIGKSFREPLVAGQNADTISGATKSCVKLIEGLNETKEVLSSLQKPPFDAEFKQTVCFLNQGELETALQRYQKKHPRSKKITLLDLAEDCPGGRLPQCPAGGAYRLTVFNGIDRVLCSEHGLDPQSSMIH